MNECSILWCGKYHQNWENELHCHNYFQMVGILSGSGTVYVDDQPYEIEKEQVFLLCPQQLHAIHCGEKNAAPLKMLDVKFTVADPALFEDLVRVGDMFHLQDFGWFVRFFDKIIAESAQQRPYYYSIISGYLLEMLVRIVRERLGQPAAAPEEEAPRVATFKGVDVAALMQYIDFNYSRIISLEDLFHPGGRQQNNAHQHLQGGVRHHAHPLHQPYPPAQGQGASGEHRHQRQRDRRPCGLPEHPLFQPLFQSEGKLHAHGIPHAQRAEPLFQLSAAGRQQPVVRLLPPAKKKQKILDNMQSNPGGFVL